jgi:RNA polymerase sigma factor for flagellar operon FliA
MTSKDLEKLWLDYFKTKDSKLKEELILQYCSLVKYVAGRLCIYLGQHVEYEDLMSYGIFGLIDAIDKFDLDKGVKFETYASLRIRGSILDSIRKLDWVPRTLRQKQKQMDQIYLELENQLGHMPSEEEVANKLNISVTEVQELEKKNSIASLISLDEYVEQNYDANLNIFKPANENGPEYLYEQQELKSNLSNAIEKLTEKEKMVITLYYFEDLTLKEISSIMNISESRVSQLHTKAVSRLKLKLGKYKNLLYDI